MGNPVALRHMPASQNSYDGRVGELALGAGQRLRHGAVPGQLSLDEAFEFGLLHCFRQRCLVGLWRARPLTAGQAIGGVRRHCPLHGIDTSQLTLIGRTGWSGVGKTFALRDRNTLPSLWADLRDKLPLDVQRYHRNAVETSELEQRHVESRIVAPHLSPLGRLQESLIRQLALDPIVQDSLQAARKCFETDDKISPTAM